MTQKVCPEVQDEKQPLDVGCEEQVCGGPLGENLPIDMGTQIVVLDRGFVYVGKVSVAGPAVAQTVKITGARNIRRWGTTQGLGELRNGPTSETVLDEVGVVESPMRAVIHFIKCTRDW